MKRMSLKKHIVFPLHPRTLNNIDKFGLSKVFRSISNISICEPLGYFDFLHLIKNSIAVVTDSGGIQEETTFMKTPCLTIRPNTERPITLEIGSNKLLDFNIDLISNELNLILNSKNNFSQIPELWDGKSSERILKTIDSFFN